MHVKSVVIGGFKSFRDADLGEEEFSPMVNCLIGKNGSGKSNFFAALQFVLGHGKYKSIASKERKDLLHEGAGNKVLSAFVELRLDNSDGRLALDTEAKEVVIRRTLGNKKDEYRVNDRSTPASEVHRMLEAAGFSPSNPYNIVQQGKIQAFATMSDAQRFDLLKEIAGTKVYEDRRNTSMAVLTETEKEMEAVGSNIKNLDARLTELSQEREEYKVYQTLEKKHKCLQYALHKREKDGAENELAKIEAWLDQRESSTSGGAQKLHALQLQLREAEKKGAAAAVAMQQHKRQRELVLQERMQWVKRQARAEVQLSSLNSKSKDQLASKKKVEAVLAAIEKQVAKKNEEIVELDAKFAAADETVQKLTMELTSLESRVNVLITKRGRHNQFSTQKERDVWLQSEVKKAKKTLDGYEAEATRLQKKAKEELPQQIEDLVAAATARRKALDGKKTEREQKKAAAAKLVGERDQLAEQRRALYREQGKLQQGIDACAERNGLAESRLNKTMPRDVQQGLKSVQDVLLTDNIPGVYGPVINLFSVDPELFTACDVVAGNSLFHIVVDSNQTASKILKVLNERKLPGRPSFYPLNRMTAKPKALPTAEDCFPLFDRLDFDKSKFTAVFADLFGRVLVCTNLAAAGAHSKSHNCDCVLVNGDKVDARGGISGGFLDRKICRLSVAAEVNKIKKERAALEEKMEALMQDASEVDQKMVKARSALQTTEDEADGALRDRERVGYELAAGEKDLRQLKEAQVQAVKAAETQAAEITSLKASLKSLEEELQTPMAQKLSAEEAAELSEKQKLLDTLKKQQSHEAAGAEVLRGELQAAQQMRTENLEKQQAQLRARLEGLDVELATSARDDQAGREVDLVKQRMEALGKEVADLEKQIETAATERTKAADEGEQIRRKMQAFQKDMGKDRAEVEERRRGRVTLINRIEDEDAELRKLGALPAGLDDYLAMANGKLQTELSATRKKLKTLSHVNKKSYDQFSQLSDTRDNLQSSFDERLVEKKTLEKLIRDCDAKKDEAVLRTFKQVKAGFAANFRDLCGHDGAHGEIVLQKREAGGRKGAQRVEEFEGVGVRVNFGVGGGVGGGGDIDLTRLSGGQKSLVALAMIFAIQECDPAPFYVFDEIDAALDADYRNNVARKIQDLSQQAQFLIVSFKREVVDIANKHFAITFKNKVSRLQRCSPAEAQELLLMNEPTSRKRPRESDDIAELPTQQLG